MYFFFNFFLLIHFFLSFFLFFLPFFDSLIKYIIKDTSIHIYRFKNFWCISFIFKIFSFIFKSNWKSKLKSTLNLYIEIFREFKLILRLSFELFFEILYFFFHLIIFLLILRTFIYRIKKRAIFENTFVFTRNRIILAHKEPLITNNILDKKYFDADLYNFLNAGQIIYVYLKFQFLCSRIYRYLSYIPYFLFYWPFHILKYILLSNYSLFLIYSIFWYSILYCVCQPVFWISKCFFGCLHWARTYTYFALHIEDVLSIWRNITFFKYTTLPSTALFGYTLTPPDFWLSFIAAFADYKRLYIFYNFYNFDYRFRYIFWSFIYFFFNLYFFFITCMLNSFFYIFNSFYFFLFYISKIYIYFYYMYLQNLLFVELFLLYTSIKHNSYNFFLIILSKFMSMFPSLLNFIYYYISTYFSLFFILFFIYLSNFIYSFYIIFSYLIRLLIYIIMTFYMYFFFAFILFCYISFFQIHDIWHFIILLYNYFSNWFFFLQETYSFVPQDLGNVSFKDMVYPLIQID